MSIRSLSKELQAKAIAELNENPSRIREDIEYIKQWLKKQAHLNPRLGMLPYRKNNGMKCLVFSNYF